MTKHRRMLSRFAICLVWGVFLVDLPTHGSADSSPETKDGKYKIRTVLDDQVAAWNKGDLKAFMAGYWNSDDLTFYSGKDKTSGWQATFERYQKRYQAEGREMGKLTFSELDIDLVGPDCAIVRGRWKLITSKETLGGLFTLLFKRKPEGWRIVHDHTSAG